MSGTAPAGLRCRRAQSWILARFDGRLALERALVLDEHLAECAACRAFERRAAALDEGLSRLPEPPLERVDLERAVAGVRRRVAAAAGERRRHTLARRGRRPLLAAAGLAALVAGALALRALLAADARVAGTGGSSADAHALAREGAVDGAAGGGGLAAPGPEDAPTTSREPVAPRPAEGEPLASAAGPAAGAPAAAPAEPLDRERLAAVRAELGILLRECAAGLAERDEPALDRAAALDMAQELERRSAHLSAWPRRRIAEGLLAEADVDTARACARYLGVRGDRLSLQSLERALARPEVAEAALRGLRDQGAAGLDGLGRALERPELVALALAGIEAVGGDAAARVLGAALARGGAPPEPLVDALVRTGAPACGPLLALAGGGTADEVLVDALARLPEAAALLDERLAEQPRGARCRVLLRAALRVDLERGLRLATLAALEREQREEALACLAACRDPRALTRLTELFVSGRVPESYLELAIHDALALEPERLAPHARAMVAAGGGRAAALLELLLANPTPDAALALIELARDASLQPDERLSAVLAVGELLGSDDPPADARIAALAEALSGLWSQLGADEARLAAATLLVLQRVAGEEPCAALLAGLPGRAERSLLLMLRSDAAGRRTTLSIYRLARELQRALRARTDPERDADS